MQGIVDFYQNAEGGERPLLMVGFNRRFSPYAEEIKRKTSQRSNPLFVHYRMNAGNIPADHWVHEAGGRIVGEACHIIDLMTFLTGSKVQSVSSEALTAGQNGEKPSDNRSIQLKYSDGSICDIEYLSVGNSSLPKEYMEVHFDGKSIVMDDYRSLKGYGLTMKEIHSATGQKGHYEELVALAGALKDSNAPWPIELWDMVQTTEVTLAVAEA